MNIKPRFGFVIEYVPDIEAIKDFYVDALGLKVERYHPTFVQFEHFAIASDQLVAGGGELELYWLIDDAEAAFREISMKAEVSLPLTQQPFGKVFGIKDPSGQPQYLLELAKDRPSEAVS